MGKWFNKWKGKVKILFFFFFFFYSQLDTVTEFMRISAYIRLISDLFFPGELLGNCFVYQQ